MSLKAVVLAAGESSRFWPLASTHHKSLYRVMDRPVMQFTLEGLVQSGITDIAVIVSPGDQTIQSYFGDGGSLGAPISYFVQEKPLGMGDAVRHAQDWLQDSSFVVTNADQVNVDQLLPGMIDIHRTDRSMMVLTGQETDTPWNYGIMAIAGEKVKRIVEKPEKGTEPSQTMVIGLYLLPANFLAVLRAEPSSHYSYEAAIQSHIDRFDATRVVVQPPDTPEITLKFPWHLFRLNRYLMDRHLAETFIHESAIISPHALISGTVHIGANVRVFEHAVIKGPAWISDGVIIGNNALVRDYSYVGQNSMVGFGTEIKNSIVYDHVETHANYIGDSIVDSGCGFGAGTITANRRLDRKNIKSVVKDNRVDSGMSFFGMVTGQNVKTGIQAGVMPGVKIGSNCFIGANTMVMEDLPDNTRCFNKVEQVIKPFRGGSV